MTFSPAPNSRLSQLQQWVVTAEQMRQIEGRVFAAGMPVAALMEKVGGLLAGRVQELLGNPVGQTVGVLVGRGHNGGDALVVARELHLRGWNVLIYCPFSGLKDLTAGHYQYCAGLGIPLVEQLAHLQGCDYLIDGLFGFGLDRPLEGELARLVEQINAWAKPVISIDLPSGLDTDSGRVMGTALRASHTLCLGLWKLGLLQEHALEYVGAAELIDFGLPLEDIQAVLGAVPPVRRVTSPWAIAQLPLQRPATTHKYEMGHLLLVCGSRRYAGGAILTGLGARASGVGMLSIAVPASLKPILTAQLPDTLVLDCPETEAGAIAQLPPGLNLQTYDAIACGPGLTTAATAVVEQVFSSDQPLVLDADGLNILTEQGMLPSLQERLAPTLLTPHLGEFRRLFPQLAVELTCRVTAVQQAAAQTGAIVLLKGARVVMASAQGAVAINPESTSALARGGSGDVLTGLIGGLWAQTAARSVDFDPFPLVAAGVWWHAQAGILAMEERTILGVDASTLTQYLLPALVRARLQPDRC